MEMNTRLQVEHPVTEMITGLDLVELQLRVAAGEPLGFAQGDLRINGHAVEARVYAEDPEHDFLPSTGKLWALRLPEEGDGVRVDSGVAEGGAVTPHYDPMIAKVIAHGATRDEALDRLSAALGATIVAGPKSNVRFLRLLADHPEFRAGKLDTGLIEREKAALGALEQPVDMASAATAGLRLARRMAGPETADPWSVADGFALSPRAASLALLIDGRRIDAPVGPEAADALVVAADEALLVVRDNRQTRVSHFDPFDVDLDAMDEAGGAAVKSPMHGKLVALMVKPGDAVAKGQKVAVVEAMKMEHALAAPRDGVVAEVVGDVGAQVGEGARVVVLREE
jgi:3-methylcrotonyl-CoA carboxylase alpha subunit